MTAIVSKALETELRDGAEFSPELDQLMRKDPLIDTIILGCTHYPLLMSSVVKNVPKGVRVQVNDRPVDGLIALRANDTLELAGVRARLVADAPVEAGNDDLHATVVRAVVPRWPAPRAKNSDRTMMSSILVAMNRPIACRAEDRITPAPPWRDNPALSSRAPSMGRFR